MNASEAFTALAAPFAPEAISWRVGSTSKDKSKGMALAYIDARDVMDRLDAVIGPENWRDEYQEIAGFVVCKLWVRIGDEWVWKCDGAGKTDVEAEKGMLSDAFKRTAVKWGVGRYLYSLDSPWVKLNEYKQIEKSEYPKLEALLRRGRPVAALTPPAAPVRATAIEAVDPIAAVDTRASVSRPAPASTPKRVENDRPATVDPKIAALNRRNGLVPPAIPTQRDSEAVRKLVLLALDFCEDMDSLKGWGAANGRQSAKFSLMLPEDQAAVLKAAEGKYAAVKAANKARVA